MHNKIAFCLSASLLLFASGCTLDEVKDKGDLCPGDKSSGAQLSYIVTQDEEKCDAESCPEYAESFEIGVCPSMLSACHVDPQNKYYCSTPCSKSMIACMGKCINPKENSRFCGAKGECNNPDESSDDFIGNTCSNGKKCDDGICTDEVCNGLTCDGKCINPDTSTEYCGAKGRCIDEDADSEDFIGINCGEHAICSNGECKCDDNYIRCDGKCVNYLSNASYCGAKGDCSSDDPDDDNYHGKTCSDGEVCSLGQCRIQSCENSDEKVCDTEDGLICINPRTNIDHCGSCGHSCNENHPENQIAFACVDATCRFICANGYENCSQEEDTITCVSKENMKNNAQHCGKCNNACDDNKRCINGECVESSCESNQCAQNGKCSNTDTACGPNCLNCSVDGNAAQGTCNNGICLISRCQPGFHRKIDASGIHCVENTNTECAKPDSDSVLDCTQISTSTGICTAEGTCEEVSCPSGCLSSGKCLNDAEHCGPGCQNCTGFGGAASAKCENSQCVIQTCPANHHIAENGQYCVANTPTACAPANSRSPENCNSRDQNGNWTCENGSCTLNSCKDNFHRYGTICEADDEYNCGTHGTQCGTGFICSMKQCIVTNCNAAVEGQLCGSDMFCKTTGQKAGESINCVSASLRDKECIKDGDFVVDCHDSVRAGLTGLCIYDPNSKYYVGNENWKCQCANPTHTFCLNKDNHNYECVSNISKCRVYPGY